MTIVEELGGFIAPHDRSELSFAKDFGAVVFGPRVVDDKERWTIRDDYWLLDGVLVVGKDKESFAVEPKGNGVRRVIFDEHGVLTGLSAHAFYTPEEEKPEIVTFFL